MSSSTVQVSLQEYLRTSYRPDVELIDGQLREKSVDSFKHGVVQGTLFLWFWNHRTEWNVLVSVDTRTEVGNGRVRLPDVVVVRKGEEAIGALTHSPLIAVEVLSPSDSYTDLKERASELWTAGCENVWLLDPVGKTAEVWTGQGWQLHGEPRLEAGHSPVYVDLPWLWAEIES